MDDFTPDRTDPRLRRALRDRLTDSAADCPDAERIAAWSEGALGAPDAALLEAHVADCARCQAILAAFATTNEAEMTVADVHAAAPKTADVVPFTPRRTMRWVLPLAAGLAATLVLWTMTRDVVPAPGTTPLADSSQALATPAAPLPSVPPPSSEQNQPRMPAEARPQRRAAERDAGQASADRAATGFARQEESRSTMPAPAPPPPRPVTSPPPGPPNPRASTITGLPQSTINITADGVGVLARATARQDAIEGVTLNAKPIAQFASTAVDALAETVSGNAAARTVSGAAGGTTSGRAGGGAGRGGGGGRGAATPVAAQAPTVAAKAEDLNLPAHWRVFAGNRVERSRDNGLTWTAIKLDADLPAVMNGAAPASQICWLVGARGLVLVTSDATTFTRVAAPAEVDLVSIEAADDRSAVVTAADGRTFTTTDGGKTWK